MWQNLFDFLDKTTLVSVRAHLPILEKIESKAELEAQPPSIITSKGAEGKHKMESIASCILVVSSTTPFPAL